MYIIYMVFLLSPQPPLGMAFAMSQHAAVCAKRNCDQLERLWDGNVHWKFGL